MKFICDACFETFRSGSIGDIPGTFLPTDPCQCARCKVMVIQGLEPTGHMVQDFPASPRPVIIIGVSGSQ